MVAERVPYWSRRSLLVEVLALSLSLNTTSNSAIKASKSCRRGDDVSRMGANHAAAVPMSRVPTNLIRVVSSK
jgi:hypothetical protein